MDISKINYKFNDRWKLLENSTERLIIPKFLGNNALMVLYPEYKEKIIYLDGRAPCGCTQCVATALGIKIPNIGMYLF